MHGDFENTFHTLVLAKLINKEGDWIGRDAILVQTGDIADRGHYASIIYRFFIRLELEAKKNGGQVIMLLGNHELMNFLGYWHDVSAIDKLISGGILNRKYEWSDRGLIGKYLRSKDITIS